MKATLKAFFKKSIDAPYDKKTRLNSFLNKTIRVLYFSITSFIRNECYLKSSILTFYSLISIVPILAIIFSIAKGFGFEEFLQKEILSTFKEQEDMISTAMRFAYAFIDHIKTQTIIGLGVLFLFFSVFGLFENIEKTLNTIWHVKKYRSFFRRFVNYFSILIIIPVFFLASTSITIFINAEIVKTAQSYEIIKYLSSYALMILKIAPYALMCFLFSYLYIVTPNSRVYFKPRIIAGIFAGAIFQFWQIIYIDFQVYISSYNVIYGSFAALPLFLIWMQINFVIFLFGAEIAAQIEGEKFFKKQSDDDRFITVSLKHLTLMVVNEITREFIKGKGPISIEYISERLGISLLDTRVALNILEKEGIIAEIDSMTRTAEQYQLIVNPELYTVQTICDLVDAYFSKQTRSRETSSLVAVNNYYTSLDQAIKNAGADLNLKNFSNLK